jgi:hypothetical protein
MARKRKKIRIKEEHWCSCQEWAEHHWLLGNFELMRFCIFCGSQLVKEKEQ